MDELNVCFVGIGSIAKRHIKNLRRICREDGIHISVDAISRSGKSREEEVFKHIQHVYSDINTLKDTYDIVFITNPTEYHIDTLEKITPFGRNFFIEKPISSLNQIERAASYKRKDKAVYYVACPLRYNAVIQYIKNDILKKEDIISVRSISSSYLPDWRPGQDYRDTYSAHKDLGGGVSIDLIHEWDYLTFLFGMPETINYMSGKKSDLDIDSEDYAIYMAEYKDKIVELHLDYFGRKTIREIMLLTRNDTIIGDIADNKIRFLKHDKTIDFHEERDDFQIRELRHFLNMIRGKAEEDSGIGHAVDVLKLTQGRV